LDQLQPDVILVEGPPDAQDLIEMAGNPEMKPPVALLIYAPDDPHKASFYPFAVYSPEWQAIQHGLRQNIPVRFMDLPHTHILAEELHENEKEKGQYQEKQEDIHHDPIGHLARAAGYTDGERWWEHMVETRQENDTEIFAAILEGMTALRKELANEQNENLHEKRREAYMRKTLRETQKEDYKKIAVVCGAWHGPAFVNVPTVKSDNELLKGLPAIKTKSAWAPWSYSRISFWTGYGAGVYSPEWYHILWDQKKNLVTYWLTRAARLMRQEQLDVSSAHVIEAVRLSEALASLRGHPLPGLEEMDEAALAVMCFGEEASMRLIRKKLVVGDRMGVIPQDAPVVPLQQDLMKWQKTLRLPAKEDTREYDFDLRKPTDLSRSHLLHRLRLLEIPWGEQLTQKGRSAGTFHEYWQLQWKPEFVMDLIQAARWGNTVENAASARCIHTADHTDNLKEIATLLDNALLADLPEAVESLISSIQERTAKSGDVQQMMQAMIPLARVMRYGNVRQTDKSMLKGVIDGLAARIMINLPGACVSINDEAAEQMFELINGTHSAITLLQSEEQMQGWASVLNQLADLKNGHNLINGRSCRLLQEMGHFPLEEAARRMSLALSLANDSSQVAAWLEGFLRGSGLILIHDQRLWQVLDDWITGLRDDHFSEVLPLLRRTFSTFAVSERRYIGQQVKRNDSGAAKAVLFDSERLDYERAGRILPLLSQILDVEIET